jgi:UPF0716 family protein affecting phage T7 exclusion
MSDIMKNIVIGLFLLIVFVIGIIQEPVTDTFDAIAGATNATYGTNIDAVAGASYDDDEYDDDDDEYEEHDDDDDEYEEHDEEDDD